MKGFGDNVGPSVFFFFVGLLVVLMTQLYTLNILVYDIYYITCFNNYTPT